ncbi:MAG TPA: glycosyltransferase family 4 protein [Acidimicrobiales bacterium]
MEKILGRGFVNRLKVAVVVDALYPWHKGGKEMRYHHLLNALPNYGVDVVVYSMKWWDVPPEVVTSELGSLTYRAICPRVALYRDTRRSVFQALLFAASTLRLLTRKFDVIEADHMPYLQLLPLRVVAWIKRVPLVITWNEVWGKEGWRTYLGRVGFAAAMVERACIQLPDFIVAVSTGTSEKLIAMGAKPSRLHVVPNAIDTEEMLNSPALESAPELLFVGRLLEHKNANLAVEAVQILSQRGLDVHLGVVGVGPEEARLRAQVANLGLGARVTFFSSIESQEELWSLMRGCRVLLAPSVREGFGIVVGESLALGTPVVCALDPENESSKLVGPATGSVIPAHNAEALADAAQFWLDDGSQRADRTAAFLGEHGELTVSAMCASYAGILRNAAGDHG